MTPKLRLTLRLLAPPVLAVVTTVLLAALSLFELSGSGRQGRSEGEAQRAALLPEPERKPLVSITAGVPELSEGEALERLRGRPDRAALARLWPIEKHREALLELALSAKTSEEIRLFLLGAFESESPKKALEAARAVVREKEILEGPLLLSAFEVLARHGERADLALFAERPGESHQLKTLREEYRGTLERRSK